MDASIFMDLGQGPNNQVLIFQVDVSHENLVREAVNKSFRLNGNIYGVINNAAISANKPIIDLSVEDHLSL